MGKTDQKKGTRRSAGQKFTVSKILPIYRKRLALKQKIRYPRKCNCCWQVVIDRFRDHKETCRTGICKEIGKHNDEYTCLELDGKTPRCFDFKKKKDGKCQSSPIVHMQENAFPKVATAARNRETVKRQKLADQKKLAEEKQLAAESDDTVKKKRAPNRQALKEYLPVMKDWE